MKKIILILSMIMILVSSVFAGNGFWDGQNNYAEGTTTLDSLIVDNINEDVVVGSGSALGTLNIRDSNGLSAIYIESPSSYDQHIIFREGTDNRWIMFNDQSTGNDFIWYNYQTTNQPLKIEGSDGSIVALPTYSATVGATNRDLYIDNSGKLGYVVSSERYKKNIIDYEDNDWIYKLRPVTYDYIDEEKGINQIGLIAEEVEKVNPNMVSYNIIHNEETDEYIKEVETVPYSQLITPLLKEVQKLNDRITALEKELSKTNPVIIEKVITDQKIDYIEQPDFKKPIEEKLGRSIIVKEIAKEEAILIKK